MSSDPDLNKILERKMEQLRERVQSSASGVKERQVQGPVALNDENFEEFVGGNRITVVDFWAPWCGPCRIISPVIEELAKEYSGRVVFGKLNVDENPFTSAKYQVQSIPTLIFFVKGEVVDRIIGAVPRDVIESRLSIFLG